MAGYVESHFAAVDLAASAICLEDATDNTAWAQCFHRRAAQLRKRMTVGIAGSTVGQLLDGLDSFYADYRNRRIRFTSAFSLVASSIAGTPAAPEVLDQLRKAAAAN